MLDYSELVNDLQKELGKRYADTPELLNVPGRSMACKLDPWYYVALHPGFVELLAKWSNHDPDVVVEALVKTATIATRPPDREPALPLTLVWSGGVVRRRLMVSFLDAAWVERGLAMFAGVESMPVADLSIARLDRPKVEAFLEGKTPVQGLSYA